MVSPQVDRRCTSITEISFQSKLKTIFKGVVCIFCATSHFTKQKNYDSFQTDYPNTLCLPLAEQTDSILAPLKLHTFNLKRLALTININC